jgi:hypothetical protein
MADHDDLHGHASADDEYLPSPDATYERTDAHVRPVARFMIWLAVLTVLTHIGIAFLFSVMSDNRVAPGEPRYPLAESTLGEIPEPEGWRLQTEPAADMQRFRASEAARLETYGWIDEGSGTVRLPIDEAMRLTLERGLPARDDGGAMETRPSDAAGGRAAE